jgi:hypothetical protein
MEDIAPTRTVIRPPNVHRFSCERAPLAAAARRGGCRAPRMLLAEAICSRRAAAQLVFGQGSSAAGPAHRPLVGC